MKADHEKASRLLKTAKGQIEGILKMIDEDRYCIDISHQIMATQAILKKVNKDIIKAHMEGCLREGIINNQDDKINEFIEIIDQLAK